jgi:gliding motility-associated-like protein
VDFSSWRACGNTIGNWNVIDDTIAIVDGDAVPPTFFVSPEEFLNVKISGRMIVENSFDDDFIGFVFGYEDLLGSSGSENYDFLLFDWKKESGTVNGYTAQEGFTLSKVKAYIPENENWKYFWGHTGNQNKFKVLKTKYGNNRGWKFNTPYDFELTYTSTRVVISINSDTIFNLTGSYESGRFGFYCFSQEHGVRYEAFNYHLDADFRIEGDKHCINSEFSFIAIDESGSSIPPNIADWKWDFDNGSTASGHIASHSFSNPGTYDVSLVIVDQIGCSDTTVHSLRIFPDPDLSSLHDTILPYNSDICLDAGNPGATYQWSTGEYSRVIEINEITNEMKLGVEVNKNGCISEKEITIEVIPPPLPALYIPNAFTPNGDGLNDYFLAEGKNIDTFSVKIFNRWGELIFESDNIYRGWNGKTNGKTAPQGTYVYIIQYRGYEISGNSSVINKKGTLQLIL